MKCLQTASAITVFPEKPGQKLFAISKTDSIFEYVCENKNDLSYDSVLALIAGRKEAFLEGDDFRATTAGVELKFTNERGTLIIDQANYLRLKQETEGLIKSERGIALAHYVKLFKKIQNIDIKNPKNFELSVIDGSRNIILNHFLNDGYYTVNDDGTLYKFIHIRSADEYFRLKKGQILTWKIRLGKEETMGRHKVLVQFDPEMILYEHGSKEFKCPVNIVDEDYDNYGCGRYGDRYAVLVECLVDRLSDTNPADMYKNILNFKSIVAQNEFIDEYIQRCGADTISTPLVKLVTCKTFEEFLEWDKH